jgi:glycosyltransferase involved in cell wall biosynthesis
MHRSINLYFYPNTTKKTSASHNPYTSNFIAELKEHYTIINSNDASSVGIFKTLKYLFRMDVLLMNWIEELPDMRGGYFQSLYFVLLVCFLKCRKKKVVWIMHNKLSHYPRNYWIKKVLFKFLLLRSDLIVTHASEGITFAKSLTAKNTLNIRFFPHPIIPALSKPKPVKEIDILIWGALTPYKSADKFLQFLYENHLEKSFTIKLAGKISSEEYRRALMKFQNENIRIEDRFIEREYLEDLVHKSKVVLFTYSDESILCSGALIDSLSLRATILGPNTGNFKDLNARGMIHVYNNYNELVQVLEELLPATHTLSSESLDSYFEETSWKKFVNALNKWIQSKKF